MSGMPGNLGIPLLSLSCLSASYSLQVERDGGTFEKKKRGPSSSGISICKKRKEKKRKIEYTYFHRENVDGFFKRNARIVK
jgi:hypothetical protein